MFLLYYEKLQLLQKIPKRLFRIEEHSSPEKPSLKKFHFKQVGFLQNPNVSLPHLFMNVRLNVILCSRVFSRYFSILRSYALRLILGAQNVRDSIVPHTKTRLSNIGYFKRFFRYRKRILLLFSS